MVLSARPGQAFEIPVISVLTTGQRIQRWILITSVVLFLITANYVVYFGNFLGLEFDVGEVYGSSFAFWKLWVSVLKIFYLAFGFFMVAMLRTQLNTLYLNVGLFLTVVLMVYDAFCIVLFLLKVAKCDSVLCYGGAGGSGVIGDSTAQFLVLLVTTAISLVLGAVVVFGITNLRGRVEQRRSQVEAVAAAEDFASPGTMMAGDESLDPADAAGAGLSTGLPLVDPSLPANDPRQPLNRPGVSPAFAQALMRAQQMQQQDLAGPSRTSLVEVFRAQRSLRNLALGLDLVLLLLSLVYGVYFGNFLALEFDAGQPYGPSLIWWVLWINAPVKLGYLAFAFFAAGRAQVSRTVAFFTVTFVVSIVIVLWDLFSLVLYLLEISACDARYCYGEAGNTGTVGSVTLQFWFLLFGQLGSALLQVAAAFAFYALVNEIRVRNSTIVRNVGDSRLDLTRRALKFGVRFVPTIGRQLVDSDGDDDDEQEAGQAFVQTRTGSSGNHYVDPFSVVEDSSSGSSSVSEDRYPQHPFIRQSARQGVVFVDAAADGEEGDLAGAHGQRRQETRAQPATAYASKASRRRTSGPGHVKNY